LWDFGDSQASNLCSPPNHVYLSKGVYTVSLAVSGGGGSDIETKTSYITVYAPVAADFSANPTSGSLPLEVAFTNLSSGDFDTCLWNYGDSQTSNLCSPPNHVYLSVGVYTVSLAVNGVGGSDIETKTSYITVDHRFYLPLVIR
jgi:PKD repeat protein